MAGRTIDSRVNKVYSTIYRKNHGTSASAARGTAVWKKRAVVVTFSSRHKILFSDRIANPEEALSGAVTDKQRFVLTWVTGSTVDLTWDRFPLKSEKTIIRLVPSHSGSHTGPMSTNYYFLLMSAWRPLCLVSFQVQNRKVARGRGHGNSSPGGIQGYVNDAG